MYFKPKSLGAYLFPCVTMSVCNQSCSDVRSLQFSRVQIRGATCLPYYLTISDEDKILSWFRIKEFLYLPALPRAGDMSWLLLHSSQNEDSSFHFDGSGYAVVEKTLRTTVTQILILFSTFSPNGLLFYLASNGTVSISGAPGPLTCSLCDFSWGELDKCPFSPDQRKASTTPR